jgi:bacillithiol synthase
MFYLKEIQNRHFYYNNLYYDYIFNFAKLKNSFFYNYNDVGQFKERINDILSYYDSKTRQNVSNILKDSNLRYGCGPETAANIEKLKEDDTFIIIGGQQPGLFGGPLFIIYKIISILKLSSFCNKELGINTVPVFWNATDDSNFAAINSAVFGPMEGRPSRIEIEPHQSGVLAQGIRYSDMYVKKGYIYNKIKELAELLLKTEFTKEVEDFLLDCLDTLPQDLRLPDFFSFIITKLFYKYGLIIFDPCLPEFKEMALSQAYFDIKNHNKVEQAIIRSTALLKNSGYHSQLKLEKGAMNFYIAEDGIRNRVHKKNDNDFFYSKSELNKAGLIKYLNLNPSALSLNVVLRPIFQDSVLPVLATVCGPGEVSYFAQLKGVYEEAGIKTGIIWPRFSATIVERKVEKSIIKSGISFENVSPDRKEMLDSSAEIASGTNIDFAIKNFEDSVILKLNELRQSFEQSGILLQNSFSRIESNIKRETDVLKKKIISEINNKKTGSSAAIQKILENIFPGDNLQERVFSAFYYINKYGFKFMDEISGIYEIRNFTHKFILFD